MIYWVIGLVAVAVVGLTWLAVQGRLGGMPPLVDDRPGPDLPTTKLTGFDVRNTKFGVVSRGYSMQQVDAVLERIASELDGTPFYPLDEYERWAAGVPDYVTSVREERAAWAAREAGGSSLEKPQVLSTETAPKTVRPTGLGWPGTASGTG